MGLPVKLFKGWIIGLFIAAALAVVAATSLGGRKPLRVRITRPTLGTVEEIVTANSVGTVEPEKTAIVASELSGKILRIAIRQGPVAAGLPVFELDPRDLEAEREVTRREGETQRQRLEQAVVRRQKVGEDLERLKGVDVPRSDVDRLKRDLEIARQEEEIAKLTIRTLEAQLGVIDLRLTKSRVLAPFDGTVVRLHAEEGESVTPGRPLFTIHSAGDLLIRAPVDEVDMGRVAPGLAARITFDAYGGRKFRGSVHEIMPAASTDQKNNRTVDIKITLPEVPANIRAGMSANVEVILRTHEGVLSLPTHLVHDDREGRGKFVYVKEGEVARRRPVRLGFTNWETSEIAGGVTAEDAVIVPLQFEDESAVAEGIPVTVVDHAR